MELAHRFFADLVRLPLIFQLLMLYGAGAAAWQWWKTRRQAEVIAASMAWPVYRARVVWAQVSDRQSRGEDGPSYCEGLLTYSYTVPGHELEVGEHRKQFENEDEAGEWARALHDTFVDVRVDAADVRRSVWQETPILTAPVLCAPELDGSRLQGLEGWDTREALAAIVFCVAAAGAAYAAWIQLSCPAGKPLITPEINDVTFFGMHLGAILCAIASSVVAQRGKWSRSTWQKSLKTGTKGPALKVLGLYTTGVFLYWWVRMAAHDGDARYFGVLIFSAGWLIFYVSAAASSLQVMQFRRNDAR